jgi:predicted nucleic acid-binding Zn ribbon protein
VGNGLRTYTYECTQCSPGERFDLIVQYSERDEQICSECQTPLTRRPTTFTANTRISRTYVDGVDRGDDYKKLKEAGQIEADMYNLPVEKRGEHEKEINKLKKVNKGD